MKGTSFIKVTEVPVMSFTKMLRLIKPARPLARLLLSKLTTKYPHVTREQHLRIIPCVSGWQLGLQTSLVSAVSALLPKTLIDPEKHTKFLT